MTTRSQPCRGFLGHRGGHGLEKVDPRRIRGADALVVDFFASWEIGAHWSLVAGLENAFDETIETRKTSDGLTYVGNPRLWTLGARYTF